MSLIAPSMTEKLENRHTEILSRNLRIELIQKIYLKNSLKLNVYYWSVIRMRLIDADNYKGKIIASHCYSGVNKLINVDDVPTAYDVDKVVEQLKLTSKTALDLAIKRIPGFRFMAPGFQALIDECFEEAVEIVKAGGNIELSEHSKSQGN